MESKKNQKVDLERKRSIFFNFGLVLALSLTLFAFEWKHTDKELIETIVIDKFDQDLAPIPPTERKEPEKPQVFSPGTVLKLVPNNTIDIQGDVIEFGPDDGVNGTGYTVINDTPEDSKKDITDEVHVLVDFNAEFPGGESGMLKYISENITYPSDERKIGMEGTTFVSFIVEKSGVVSNVEVVRPLSPNLDNEAIRVVKNMPVWKPANFHGKIVRQKFVIPFKFSLK